MKFFLLIGGGCGFLLGFSSGLFAGNEIMIAVRDGAVGCTVGALLMKGFSAVFIMSLNALATERAKDRLQRNEARSH